jgi:hypothetical protein
MAKWDGCFQVRSSKFKRRIRFSLGLMLGLGLGLGRQGNVI